MANICSKDNRLAELKENGIELAEMMQKGL